MPIVTVLCLYGVFLWIGIAAGHKASGGGWSDLPVAGPVDVGPGAGLAGRRIAGLSGVLHGRVLGDVDPGLAAGGSAARSPP